jgi:cytochrome c oxidase cbb3-type subunit I
MSSPQDHNPTAEHNLPVSEIDASCRGPVLFFFFNSLLWLGLGSVLLLISSIKLHGPGFLANIPWLTFGRVRPAALDAILYGFATQAAFGLLLWFLCRLGRVVLGNPPAILIAGLVWNLGVTLGFIALLAGASTGFLWLEMPRFVSAILFVAFAVIGAWALVTFHRRRTRPLYVSQWYLLAALFWFAWSFSGANLLLFHAPVRGTVQAAVNAWYVNNLLGLWLVPVSLGAIFYFIPKILGTPLHSRSLAVLGFWTLALFGSWTGLTHVIGGPLPAWMISASIAANLAMLVPLLAVAWNWSCTISSSGQCQKVLGDTTLRYVLAGALCYLVASGGSIILGTREVGAVLRFTYAETARQHLAVLGGFGLVAFGAMHYIVPRLMQRPWPSARLVKVHWFSSAAGLALYFLALTAAGIVQGFKVNDPAVPFVNAIRATVPFVGLSTLGLTLWLVGQLALLFNMTSLLRQCCAPICQTLVNAIRAREPVKAEVRV